MNVKLSAFALVLVAVSGRFALAQYPGPFPGQQIPAAPIVLPSYGTYDHASTLEEGAANGLANLIQGAGAGNLLHSQAARNYEEAYSRSLDNRIKSAQTYYEVRKMNREDTIAARGPRPTAAQLARHSKERAPSRLGVKELDPLTGRIMWPVVLEDESYKPYRENLDELVAKWVRYNGSIGADEYLALQQSVKAMESELKLRIREYNTADYVKAKNILSSLAYEVVKHENTLAAGDVEEVAAPAAPRLRLPVEGITAVRR